ncbi:MAG: rhomboid family intramembrane serine protease [Nannocystaceae bacterium]|nr:rhomboid family intramembrane serine protease [Myxococcales bacterium]
MARNPSFAALPRFRRGAFWLFLSVALATILLADQPYASRLLLGPEFGGELALWQPITALFVFPEGHLGGLFLTLVVQWIVGGPVEERWGTARYLGFVIGCALAGTVTTALLGLVVPAIAATQIGGSLPLDLAALVAFGVIMGRAQLRLFGALPITGRTLAIVAAVLAIVSPLARGAPWAVVLPSVITLVTAYLAAARPWKGRGKSGKLSSGRGKPRRKPKKSHLRVVPRDDSMLH